METIELSRLQQILSSIMLDKERLNESGPYGAAWNNALKELAERIELDGEAAQEQTKLRASDWKLDIPMTSIILDTKTRTDAIHRTMEWIDRHVVTQLQYENAILKTKLNKQ